MLYKKAGSAVGAVISGRKKAAIYLGDCRSLFSSIPNNSVDLVVTSPPYCIGKEYEGRSSLGDFQVLHRDVMPEVERVLRPGGSACWQVGYHVQKNRVTPLDFLVYGTVAESAPSLILRNRIVWHFGHGQHCDRRFSGRHETVLWFTKGENYQFDQNSVRVPQKYPGKRASKGPRQGEFSGNPLGKNPSDVWADVWDIPNVKANHVEKLQHPCQFPVALVRRLVLALCPVNGLVVDPFAGVASAGVAAVQSGRRFLGSELIAEYAESADRRLGLALKDKLETRKDVEVQAPKLGSAVATKPSHFWPGQLETEKVCGP